MRGSLWNPSQRKRTSTRLEREAFCVGQTNRKAPDSGHVPLGNPHHDPRRTSHQAGKFIKVNTGKREGMQPMAFAI